MDLHRTLDEALERLAPSADRLLVGVSGGADSVAALRLLVELGRDVVVAHLDHGLRPDSGEDARFVAELSRSLGVKHVSERVEVGTVAARRGWNLEDAARRVRYEFLNRAAAANDCAAVVVAHTLDDQAETFMLQALRGSAYPAGMPARRGQVIRPLLSVQRADLRDYLTSAGNVWREDPSNLDSDRTRAWLRHEVMPVLAKRQPQAASHLARTAAVLGEAREALALVAARLFGQDTLRVAALARAPAAVRRAAIAGLLERSGAAVNADLVAAIDAAATAAAAAAATAAADSSAPPWRRSVGADTFVRVAYGRVEVASRLPPLLRERVSIAGLEDWQAVTASLPPGRPAVPPAASTIATLAARYPDLVLRHRQDGDKLELAAGHKLLSDVLIDAKVPVEERDALLVLASGSTVLWHEVAEGAGSDENDARFMRLALQQAEWAAESGDLPVGAVLVRGDEVLAAAHNRSQVTGDASAHAELEAIRLAGAAATDWRLAGTTLYVTLEPCPMCFGAVLQTRIDRVVFGADNLREGALGGVIDMRLGAWKRVPAVEGGVLGKECRRQLSGFFAARRRGESAR